VFKGDDFSIKSESDMSSGLPVEVSKDSDILVNGSFFVTACQRILNTDIRIKLFFDEELNRLTLVNEEDNLIFLIQGLYNI